MFIKASLLAIGLLDSSIGKSKRRARQRIYQHSVQNGEKDGMTADAAAARVKARLAASG
jgi:hypothetical protein